MAQTLDHNFRAKLQAIGENADEAEAPEPESTDLSKEAWDMAKTTASKGN